MVSIWISDKHKPEILKAVAEHNELDCEALFKGYEIDELYIEEDTGDIVGFVSVGPIGVSMDLKFADWFPQFINFSSFHALNLFLDRHKEEVQKTIDCLKKPQSLQGSANDEV